MVTLWIFQFFLCLTCKAYNLRNFNDGKGWTSVVLVLEQGYLNLLDNEYGTFFRFETLGAENNSIRENRQTLHIGFLQQGHQQSTFILWKLIIWIGVILSYPTKFRVSGPRVMVKKCLGHKALAQGLYCKPAAPMTCCNLKSSFTY